MLSVRFVLFLIYLLGTYSEPPVSLGFGPGQRKRIDPGRAAPGDVGLLHWGAINLKVTS